MNSKLKIVALLFLLSLINPLVFNHYYGHHKKLSESSYLVQNTNLYDAEYLIHTRFLYEGYKNLQLGRFDMLSVIDETNPLYSFPHFQFYNVGPSLILGLSNFIFKDALTTYIFAIWLATLLYSTGIFLLAKKLTRSTSTALLLPLVFITAPYYITNFLSRSAFPEYIALSLLPLLIWQLVNFLEITKTDREEGFWGKYIFQSCLLVLTSSIFLLTHNITSLFSILILGVPFSVYVFTRIKPTLRSIFFLFPPLLLTVGSVLFYWFPIILYGNKTNISSTYSLLQEGLKWSPWNVVLSPLPLSPPEAINTELYLQIGLPLLLLTIFFFRREKIYVYVLLIIVFVLISFNVWSLVPNFFHSIQFSLRLLGYIPLLLLLIAVKLNRKAFVTILLVTVVSASLFYQRDKSFYHEESVSLQSFPIKNDWGFYQNTKFNASLSPTQETPEKLGIQPEVTSNTYLIDTLDNKDNLIKALTYEIEIKTKTGSSENLVLIHKQEFAQKTEEVVTPVTLKDGFFFHSTCVTNHKTSVISLVNNDTNVQEITSLTVKRFSDKNNAYIDGQYPYSCDYTYNSPTTFSFNFDKPGEQIILPIFYSDLNKFTDKTGNEVAPLGGLMYGGHSFTVFDKLLSSESLEVDLMSKNRFLTLAKFSSSVTFILFLFSLALLVFKPRGKLKFVSKFYSN